MGAKKITEHLASGIIGALVGFVLSIFVDTGPKVRNIQYNTEKTTEHIESINSNINEILMKYLKRDNEGIECRVGYSAAITNNNVSVFLHNKFDLKRGDRIELTYIYGVMKVSIECFVHFVEQSPQKESEADFFISKDIIDIFQIPKEEQKKGVFEMRFKHLSYR